MAMVHGRASGNREKWLEPVALVATICHQPVAVLQSATLLLLSLQPSVDI